MHVQLCVHHRTGQHSQRRGHGSARVRAQVHWCGVAVVVAVVVVVGGGGGDCGGGGSGGGGLSVFGRVC